MAAAERAVPDVARPALPFSLVAAWAAPGLPVNFVTGLLGVYFLKFGTDVLLVAPGALGLVLGLSRLWDGVASPVIGFLSDRTRHRLGRRRSWILAAALPSALTCVMVWSPPRDLSQPWLLAWLGAGLFAFATSLACLEVPRTSLPAELSSRGIDRARLFATNGVVLAVSNLLALTLGIGWLRTASDPRQAAFDLSVALALFTLLSVAWLVARLREPPGNLGRGGRSPLLAWGHVLRNPHQQRIMASNFLQSLPMGAMSVLAPYLFQYTLRRPELTEAYMVAFFVPHLVSVPIWVRLTRRFRKLHLWIASLGMCVIGYLVMFSVMETLRVQPSAPGATALLLAVPMLLGFGMGCQMVVPSAIGAEVIDYDELMSGERKEGVYTAIGGVVFKVGSAVSIALAGFALEWSGFRLGGEQDERVATTILWAMTLLPALFIGLSMLPLLRFRLTEGEHARILWELEARQRAAEAAGGRPGGPHPPGFQGAR